MLLLAVAVVPRPAHADVGLIVRRSAAYPGELMTVWGGFRQPIYLLRDALARRLNLWASPRVRRPPLTRPFIFVGRTSCTGRHHYIGDFPHGDFASWSGKLRFRIPDVRPGVYQLILYCAPCRRGPGGSLVVNTWLWHGSERIGATGLRIRRQRPR